MTEYLSPSFWKRRENHPFPWVLLGVGVVAGGVTLGVGAAVVALVYAPDILEYL